MVGSCYVFTKEQFIEQINKLVKKDDAIIFSTIKQGSMGGLSKRNLKHFDTGFTSDCFKDSQGISDLLSSVTGGIIILEKKFQSDDVRERIKSSVGVWV